MLSPPVDVAGQIATHHKLQIDPTANIDLTYIQCYSYIIAGCEKKMHKDDRKNVFVVLCTESVPSCKNIEFSWTERNSSSRSLYCLQWSSTLISNRISIQQQQQQQNKKNIKK